MKASESTDKGRQSSIALDVRFGVVVSTGRRNTLTAVETLRDGRRWLACRDFVLMDG
jgi:hypothetical protein